MNTKPIPAIVMLIAGFTMCVVSITNGYDLSFLIRRLLFVLLGFYLLGYIIKLVLDTNCKKQDKKFTIQDLGFTDGEIIEDEEVAAEDIFT